MCYGQGWSELFSIRVTVTWKHGVTVAWKNRKKRPLPCKGCCNFFLYAMFCAQSGFLLAHFCVLTRFLLRATELEHDAEVLCSLCPELVFHYNKSILFNLTLSMRFEAHTYSCDSCINTYLDKFHCLPHVKTAEVLASPYFCMHFLVLSLAVACPSLTLMKLSKTQLRADAVAQNISYSDTYFLF